MEQSQLVFDGHILPAVDTLSTALGCQLIWLKCRRRFSCHTPRFSVTPVSLQNLNDLSSSTLLLQMESPTRRRRI